MSWSRGARLEKVLTLFLLYEVVIILIYDEKFFYHFILTYTKKELKKVLKNKETYYNEIKKNKKNGVRLIKCIEKNSDLYNIQSNLKNNFLIDIPLADKVYGFVKGYSYQDFLEIHINKEKSSKYYLRLDIENFFDSITKDLLEEIFEYYITINNDQIKYEILNFIVDIISLNKVLPQGAVTSPTVSNIVFRQLDIRLQKYCRKLNVNYSRYADDILFSSENNRLFEDFFMGAITTILKSKGFKINYSKVIKSENEISLNGFVVGNNIRLSRKRKKDISKVLFLYEKGGKKEDINKFIDELNNDEDGFLYRNKVDDLQNDKKVYFYNEDSLINYLAGYRSFLIDWIPPKKDKYYEKHIRLINKLEEILIEIS